MKNILFYKYTKIDDVSSTKEVFLKLCGSLKLLGTILIAEEGINGCLSGNNKDINNFKAKIRKDKRFSDIQFKEGFAASHTFKRLAVKIKNEIITSGFGIDISKKADYIKPLELKKLLDKKEDFILLDARNRYEYEIGKFKGSITLPIKTFKEFKKSIKIIRHLKNKKIIAYCTGGIRCEKASALLKEKGFKNMQQLYGGILNYGKECGDAHWEGKCFVFDNREAIDLKSSRRSS